MGIAWISYVLIIVLLAVELVVSLSVGFSFKKKGKQYKTGFVLGITSGVFHFIYYFIIFVFDICGIELFGVSYKIFFTMIPIIVVEIVLAVLSVQKRGCGIALLILGILTLSIFDIVGGVFAFKKDEHAEEISEENAQANIPVGENSLNYYYPEDGRDLFGVVKNFGNTGSFTVRFDGSSAPVRPRAYLIYGEEEESYVFCELAYHYEVPLENRCVSLKIVRDEKGQTAFRAIGAVTDKEMQTILGNDIQTILRDKDEGAFMAGNLREGVRFGVDLRMTAEERQGVQGAEAETEGASRGGAQKRYADKPLPVKSESWFRDRGIRLERTAFRKRDIRRMSGEEKRMICFTTFPAVFKALVFVSAFIGGVLVAALVAFIVGLASGKAYNGLIYLAAVLMVSLIGGSFFVNPHSRILDGFDELWGTRALNLSIGYKIWLHVITPVSLLWGCFSNFIYTMLDRGSEAKARSLPLAVVPVGCGFDDMVAYYAEYERECIKNDSRNRELDKARENYYKGVKAYDEGVSLIEKDPSLNHIDKAMEKSKFDGQKLKLDKKYEEKKEEINKKYE